MRLSYRQIEYLREVARQKSVAGACKHLNISQSSVLVAINLVEEISGIRVFYRKKGRGMELTPAGQELLISVRKFLAAGDEFERILGGFSKTKAPTLKLGCFSPLGALLIPPVLKRYLDAYGQCEIVLMEGNQGELRSWLASGDVDLVVTYGIGEVYGSGIIPICRVPAHALLSRNDPDSNLKEISMEALARKPHILLDLPETRSYLLALFDFIGQRPHIALKTRSYETIRTAVANGLGASVLNIKPTETSPDTRALVRIPISDKLKQPNLLVADLYGNKKPEYVRSFIQVLYQYIVDVGTDKFAVVKPEFASGLIYPKPEL